MADPENLTLRLLREMDRKSDALQNEMREGFESVNNRLNNLQKALIGESVLGRYTVAEVEERIGKIEERIDAFEKKR